MRTRLAIRGAVVALALVVGLVAGWDDALVVLFVAIFIALAVYGTRFMRGYDKDVDRENERRYADSVRRGTDWL